LEAEGNMIKTLGMIYDMERDEWSINALVQQVADMRKGILATMMSSYYPMAMNLPITTEMKIAFREICKKPKTWDPRLKE
jgi:Pao retrotransposon peptidase